MQTGDLLAMIISAVIILLGALCYAYKEDE